MNKSIKTEILHNLEVRKDLKTLFDRLKGDTNKPLTRVDPDLIEIKFSSLIDGSMDDIWCFLFYLNHTGYLSLDELKHLVGPLQNSEADLVTDSKGLVNLINSIQNKVDPKNIESSINKLDKPKDIYEKYIYQRALFEFDYIIDLE